MHSKCNCLPSGLAFVCHSLSVWSLEDTTQGSTHPRPPPTTGLGPPLPEAWLHPGPLSSPGPLFPRWDPWDSLQSGWIRACCLQALPPAHHPTHSCHNKERWMEERRSRIGLGGLLLELLVHPQISVTWLSLGWSCVWNSWLKKKLGNLLGTASRGIHDGAYNTASNKPGCLKPLVIELFIPRRLGKHQNPCVVCPGRLRASCCRPKVLMKLSKMKKDVSLSLKVGPCVLNVSKTESSALSLIE